MGARPPSDPRKTIRARNRGTKVHAPIDRVLEERSIDHSVYPDRDRPPETLETPEAKADYVHRICSAWDFGVQPDEATFDLFSQWREIFDQFPIVTSPAYHAFRSWLGWKPVPPPPNLPTPTLRWEHLDRLEGRPPDSCEEMV